MVFVIEGTDEFFKVTKYFHNAFTENMKKLYLDIKSRDLDLSAFDYVVVHDPQPVPLIEFHEPY